MAGAQQGVNEMTRLVRPGGTVAAYTWNLDGGGFPYEAVHRACHASGLKAPSPPHPEAGDADELAQLWTAAGLETVKQREISVTRSFRDFDQYWELATLSPRIAAILVDLASDQLVSVRDTARSHV